MMSLPSFHDVLPELKNSEVIILDFKEIPYDLPPFKNMKMYFEECIRENINPKSPQNRQKFNDYFIDKAKKRYLIGRYGEDRLEMLRGSHIAEEGRTIHLGIDLFCKGLETVYAPFDGEIVRTGHETDDPSFGYYVFIKHVIDGKIIYTFYAHLSHALPNLGKIKKGQAFAKIGDHHENGGWSRHLHFQLFTELPVSNGLIGYSTKKDFARNQERFPDPRMILGNMY